jgi:diguanylate cyclase (GGDEF)-like protein
MLGWVLAAYSAWVGIVMAPGVLMPWIGVVVAVIMSWWAGVSPARKPGKIAIRFGMLAAATVVIFQEPQLGGVIGPMWVWPTAVAIASAFILRPSWALGLTAIAAGCYVAAGVLGPPVNAVQLATATFAMLTLSALAYAFGSTLRSTDEQLEAAMTDLKTKLYNETGLFTYGNELLQQCRARKRPLCMLLLNGSDMQDIDDLVGRLASERMLKEAVQGIMAVLPPGGLAARLGHAEFAILVPGYTLAKAIDLVHQRLGRPPQVQIEVKGQQLSVILDMEGQEVMPDMIGLELVYERLYARLGKMRRSINSRTSLLSDESYMPNPDRAISPTVPMDLLKRR